MMHFETVHFRPPSLQQKQYKGIRAHTDNIYTRLPHTSTCGHWQLSVLRTVTRRVPVTQGNETQYTLLNKQSSTWARIWPVIWLFISKIWIKLIQHYALYIPICPFLDVFWFFDYRNSTEGTNRQRQKTEPKNKKRRRTKTEKRTILWWKKSRRKRRSSKLSRSQRSPRRCQHQRNVSAAESLGTWSVPPEN